MNKEQKLALEDAIQSAVSEYVYEAGISHLNINVNINVNDGWVKAEIRKEAEDE